MENQEEERKKLNEKVRTFLPDINEYRNIKFDTNITELGYNVNEIFDPKIKLKVINLLKKDIEKRKKAAEKERRNNIKKGKKIFDDLYKKGLKLEELKLEKLRNFQENAIETDVTLQAFNKKEIDTPILNEIIKTLNKDE